MVHPGPLDSPPGRRVYLNRSQSPWGMCVLVQILRRGNLSKYESFSQFLVGSASLERPSFFYAYAGMWLHLIVSLPILVFLVDVPLLDALSSMAISSLSLGIIVYSLLSREYGLLVNVLSYALSLGRAVNPADLGYTFLVIAIIISLASGYMLLSSEYRRYTREIHDGESGVPLWLTVCFGTTLLLLFIYGIRML